LILGLTASPGGTEEKIKEICKNLFIEKVEIRTEVDEDVKPYVKEIRTEVVKVELPENLKNAQELLKVALRKRLDKLKSYNIYVRTKKDLLEAQKRASGQLATERKPILFYLISLIVSGVKIWHVSELLETQSIKAVNSYLDKISLKKTKSDKGILNDPDFLEALKIIRLSEEHPKIEKLKEVIKREVEGNKNIAIIVFSHYRDNIFNLQNLLEGICRPVVLIGQGGEKGLSQKEQIDVIKDFNAGYYNCLITSPIGEEGLHIPSADTAIFYDSVPSEIRTIQRRGRVGRTKVGKIVFLITKGTRDEGYYWSAQRKEKKMKEILRDMKSKQQQSIDNFIE
jgi:Fanconi anemia group M protein